MKRLRPIRTASLSANVLSPPIPTIPYGREIYPSLKRRRSLVRILAGCLDDGRPAIDFTLQRALGSFRRSFILRHRCRVDFIESPHKIRILECRLERGGELLDDGGRRSLGRKHAMPYSQLEAFQSDFIG